MKCDINNLANSLEKAKSEYEQESNRVHFLDADLSDFEKQFCVEYIANGYNATKAAIACGWKESTANSKAYKLVGKVGIQREIKRLQDLRLHKIFESDVMTKSEILKLWSDIARGTLINPNALPQKHFDKQLSFIDEENDEYDIENLKIPVSSRLKASELLAKNMDMLAPDSVNNNTYNNYSNCSDEELRKKVEALMNGQP